MYGADDPRYGIPDPKDIQPQTPQTPVSTYGTPPPFFSGTTPPFAPGHGWADAGPQRDPQGNMWNWNATTNAWEQQAAPTQTAGPTQGPGPQGSMPSPFSTQFTPPAPVNLGGPAGISYIPPTPSFAPPAQRIAPPFQAPDPFKAPSMQDVLNDPGYQFPLSQGLGAYSNSRAAQGLWGTGATGKGMQDYSQNYANQFYGNIYNRDLSTYQTNYGNAVNAYNTNYGTQYKDPNTYDYQAAKDALAPQILGYQTQASAGQHQNDMNYSNAYSYWLDQYNQKLGTARFLLDTANS